MKFSWGTGIFIYLILFLTACGIFMWFAFSQKLNLVEEDYYEKGVKYSNQMKLEQRSGKFNSLIYFQENNSELFIYFPDNFNEDLKNGKILFFRPSDNLKDIEFDMDIKNGRHKIPKEKLIKGRYLVRISWISDQEYYVEKEYFVQ
jgi:hypothetical protein